METVKPITILIADDQGLVRDGLAAILSMEDGYEVVAKCPDGQSALEKVRELQPQIVLMDIRMPNLDGLQATARIIQEAPDTRVIVLTTFEDESYILEALRCGASGYLAKGTDLESLLLAIGDCLKGRINYPASIRGRLSRLLGEVNREGLPVAASVHGTMVAGLEAAPADAPAASKPALLDVLTSQEHNILNQLMLGKSNRQIASDLALSTGTVKNYLNVIYKKLNVSNRTEAIMFLHRRR